MNVDSSWRICKTLCSLTLNALCICVGVCSTILASRYLAQKRLPHHELNTLYVERVAADLGCDLRVVQDLKSGRINNATSIVQTSIDSSILTLNERYGRNESHGNALTIFQRAKDFRASEPFNDPQLDPIYQNSVSATVKAIAKDNPK